MFLDYDHEDGACGNDTREWQGSITLMTWENSSFSYQALNGYDITNNLLVCN